MRVVLASNNAGKAAEMHRLLAPLGWEVVAQKEFSVPEADETGLSFVENAILKARNATEHTGLPAIADDSGIEVDALNGAPGIYSARYAGPDASDADNNQKLLEALRDTPPEKRTARFQCVIAFMRHAQDPTPLICQAAWEGVIADELCGENGFGYDPLFYVPSRQLCSAQLAPELKNLISHRAKAIRKLVQMLDPNHNVSLDEIERLS